MSKKLTKTLIKHCNACFWAVKGLVNGFEFFWNDIFYQNFNIKLNKKYWKFSQKIQEHFKNIFHKSVTKLV
jgi:hypothetical protein